MKNIKYDQLLKKESKAFDNQTRKRINKGFVPDLQNLKKINWFYNNPWRDPKIFDIHWGEIINKIIKESKYKNNKILEIGCGSGFLTLELARNGLDVTGIDISAYSISIANKYKEKNKTTKGFGELNYICCNFLEFFSKTKFDTIIFFRSLHHFPDINQVFKKIHKLSKKDTKLLIFEPVRENFNFNSALIAMIIRLILPTWINYKSKIPKKISINSINMILNDITNEYTYQNNKGNTVQSLLDNSISDEAQILKFVKKYFKIYDYSTQDSISDKIIGGIRGKDRYILAKFIKELDKYLIHKKLLKGTSLQVFAKKNI